MTKDKDFKRRVRERMDKTGESYTTARAHLAGTPPPEPVPERELPPRELANSIVEAFVDGRLDDVRAAFDDRTLRAISREYLRDVADELTSSAGDLEHVGDPLTRQTGGNQLFDYPLRYERMNAHMQVVLREGAVVGLVALPGNPTGRWRRSQARFREMIKVWRRT